jgi:SAM-dependent methyltransferase
MNTTEIANVTSRKNNQYLIKNNAECLTVLKHLDLDIKLAVTQDDINEVKAFRGKYYRVIYPVTYAMKSDPYYNNSYHFYYTNEHGRILGTVTIALDCSEGLPSENIISEDIFEFRKNNLICAEVGRFLVAKHSEHEEIKKRFYRFFYLFSQAIGIDVIVAMFKENDIHFLENIIGSKILCKNTKQSFGSKNYYASVAWVLEQTNDNFYLWANFNQKNSINIRPKNVIFDVNDWDEYAKVFSSVQTSFQRDIQQAAIPHLSGEVADFGCGSAKLAPFLASISSVSGYTGIDYSEAMTKVASWIINQFPHNNFTVVKGKIEEYQDKKFDSGVSINSYQSWPEPIVTLKHIYSLLKKGAKFTLASPNNNQNILNLAKEVDKELIAHPDYARFKELNISLASNTNGNFISMNTLLQQVQSVGFEVIYCHQEYYLGGLNFIVMKRT